MGNYNYQVLNITNIDDGIVKIEMNRPNRLNAFNEVLHEELPRAIYEVSRDDSTRVIILTGAGRAFSAGGDLGWATTLSSPKAFRKTLKEGYEVIRRIIDAPQPVIAALNGPAIGLGASIALHCDMVIASDDAFIADPHVSQVGVVAGDGGAVIWPLLIGHMRAKQYLFTGDRVDAKTAEKIGLINMAVPGDELEQTVMEWAHRLSRGPAVAIQYTKLMVNRYLRRAVDDMLEASLAFEGLTFQTPDHAEALKAFREKRLPEFTGE